MADSEFSRARRRIKGPSHSHSNWFRGLGPQSPLLITAAPLNPLCEILGNIDFGEEKDQQDFLPSCFSCYMLICGPGLAGIQGTHRFGEIWWPLVVRVGMAGLRKMSSISQKNRRRRERVCLFLCVSTE